MNEYALSDDELLTIPEVAVVLKISASAGWAYAKRGDLPGVVRLGRAVRVSRKALERWLAQQIESVTS